MFPQHPLDKHPSLMNVAGLEAFFKDLTIKNVAVKIQV